MMRCRHTYSFDSSFFLFDSFDQEEEEEVINVPAGRVDVTSCADEIIRKSFRLFQIFP